LFFVGQWGLKTRDDSAWESDTKDKNNLAVEALTT
jgi:hypothetical protein